MMKIRMIALGLALSAGVAVAAEAQQTQPRRPQGAAGERGAWERGQMGRGRDMALGRGQQRPGRAIARAAFRGIELSQQERTALRNVEDRYLGERRKVQDATRAALRQAQDARQRGDTTAARRAIESIAQQRTRLVTLAQQQRVDVRNALSAENRTRLDQNVSQLRERARGRAMQGRMQGRGGRGMGPAYGPRGQRQLRGRGFRGGRGPAMGAPRGEFRRPLPPGVGRPSEG